MKALRLLWAVPAAGVLALAGGVFIPRGASAPAGPDKAADLKPAATLPVTQVILFNSGVGHFTRSGEVEGDARVDLTFPEQDINDLIKSMTLRDLSPNGRVAAVTYDSHDPIDRTLASFAINLNGSPNLASILTQARGEQVEVTLVNIANQPGNLTGKIIGVEQQQQASKEGPPVPVTVLNLWCAEGVRAVKLNEVQRLRFTNPVIENEVRRALETLALSHDSQKKAVSLHFTGEGKRKVEVGYVVENPIWKTSYRLVLKDGKPYLQGWAVVENPTDEDWAKVTMALVSGRPISFKMDLYNPLYVGRPTVEPELFASLRPPTYSGAMARFGITIPDGQKAFSLAVPDANAIRGFAKPGALVDIVYLERTPAGKMRSATILRDILVVTFDGGTVTLAVTDAQAATLNLAEKKGQVRVTMRSVPLTQSENAAGRLEWIDDPFDVKPPLTGSGTSPDRARFATEVAGRLKQGLDLGASVQSVATASALGDYYQYVIDRPVDLARQKSALLPIVSKDVEGKRVSIYNPAVQPKHPLLGLKFKNTSGMPLSQGPVTVFDGSVYAGDARVVDLQPDEERLISYAIDLGTEVSAKNGNSTSRITRVKAVKGIVMTATLYRVEQPYDISNRSTTDRTLLIEYPNRKGQGFKFVGPNKPKEEAADVYRFEVAVGAKKDLTYTVIEEREGSTEVRLTNDADDQIKHFLTLQEAPATLKAKLQEAMTVKASWDKFRQEIATADRRVQTITADQKRLRENLRETPKDSKLFEKYLKTLEDQEQEMDDLQAKLKTLHADEAKARAAFDTFLANLTAE